MIEISKLKQQAKDLTLIDGYRKAWLALSSLVVATVLGIIFGWNYIVGQKLAWVASSCGLLISMVWWYWTMRLIRYLIHYKITESHILEEIIVEIKEIKQEIVKKSST